MKLAVAEKMRALDASAIHDYGIPGIVLMENAGKGTVDIIARRYGGLQGKIVAIFVGPGNNGGDGFVIARFLHQLGAFPHVFVLVAADKIKGDAAVNFEVVKKLPIPIQYLLENNDITVAVEAVRNAKVLVDAIFGTGLKRVVGGHFARVIELINDSAHPVVSVDIPSGLDSDSGRPLGVSVEAEMTVTYGLAKPGQVVCPGVDFCGELHVVDIGIPPQVIADAEINIELLDKQGVSKGIPERSLNSHKGSYGHLLILAGSEGKTGAALLAGQGALRSGSGLVSLCVPGKLSDIIETGLFEAMTVPMGKEGYLTINDYADVKKSMLGKDAIVLGPGIGLESETVEFVKKLYCESTLPMVVDADGLNCFSGSVELLARSSGERILTPHPGEMARLTGIATKDIQSDRLAVASSFAVEHGVLVVLKGAATVIAAPNGQVAVNPTGNPVMAVGGMGDVLAGVIGSLLGQGVSAWQAACLGVYVHGLAADRLTLNSRVGSGVLASEVASELPLAFQEITEIGQQSK